MTYGTLFSFNFDRSLYTRLIKSTISPSVPIRERISVLVRERTIIYVAQSRMCLRVKFDTRHG